MTKLQFQRVLQASQVFQSDEKDWIITHFDYLPPESYGKIAAILKKEQDLFRQEKSKSNGMIAQVHATVLPNLEESLATILESARKRKVFLNKPSQPQ